MIKVTGVWKIGGEGKDESVAVMGAGNVGGIGKDKGGAVTGAGTVGGAGGGTPRVLLNQVQER